MVRKTADLHRDSGSSDQPTFQKFREDIVSKRLPGRWLGKCLAQGNWDRHREKRYVWRSYIRSCKFSSFVKGPVTGKSQNVGLQVSAFCHRHTVASFWRCNTNYRQPSCIRDLEQGLHSGKRRHKERVGILHRHFSCIVAAQLFACTAAR